MNLVQKLRAATVVLLGACPLDALGGCGTDNGSGGYGSKAASTAECNSMCEKGFAVECPNDEGTREECVAMCVSPPNVPQSCFPVWNAYVSCANNAGTIVCGSDGVSVLKGCESQEQVVLDCATATPIQDGGKDGSASEAGHEDGAASESACTDCVLSRCSAELSACGAGTDCETHSLCLLACSSTDKTCFEGCTAQHPEGAEAAIAVRTCPGAQCSEPCRL